jgi:hypothetical protein
MTGKKIKIALCLSGEPRSSMACFPYIYETFLKPNPTYETDVFVHSFKGFRALDLYSPKQIQINTQEENDLFGSWINPPEQFNKEILEKLNNSIDLISINSNPIKNLFLMFYGVNNCMNLIQNPSEYQIFIRCRFDIIFQNPFIINDIVSDILKDKYDIFTPAIFNSIKTPNRELINDQLSIMNYKAAISYKNTIFNLINLINQTKSVRSEKLLFYQLQKNNLRTHQNDLNMKLIRNTFINSHPPSLNFLDQ